MSRHTNHPNEELRLEPSSSLNPYFEASDEGFDDYGDKDFYEDEDEYEEFEDDDEDEDEENDEDEDEDEEEFEDELDEDDDDFDE